MEMLDQITDKAKDMANTNNNNNKTEGDKTKKLEQVTAALPSSTWLMLGGGAMVASIAFKIAGKTGTANFIGQWVPTILMLGLYNKVVKVMGSDRPRNGAAARD